MYSKQEKYIDRQPLIEILEVMLKENVNTSNTYLRNFDRVDLMALVSIQKFSFLTDKEEQRKLKITQLQAIEIVHDILRIYLNGQKNPPFDERTARAFVECIYSILILQLYLLENENGIIEWGYFIQQLKHQFRGAIKLIKLYFANKFMRQTFKVIFFLFINFFFFKQTIPILSTPSYILNDDWLFLLIISAFQSRLNGSIKLQLLYSNLVNTDVNKNGFEELVNALLNSNLPTLILLQHDEEYTALHDRSRFYKSNVIGAISNQRWYNTGVSCGINQDCIFSLYPQFHLYFGRKDKGCQRNFQYLNYRIKEDQPQGIGFGGTADGHDCRLWIDQNFTGSYCRDEDSVYENGPLLMKHIKELKINLIEVWGIVWPETDEEVVQEQWVPGQIIQQNQKEEKVEGDKNFYWNQEPQSNFYWAKEESSDEEVDNDLTKRNLLSKDPDVSGFENENENGIKKNYEQEPKKSIEIQQVQKEQGDKNDRRRNENEKKTSYLTEKKQSRRQLAVSEDKNNFQSLKRTENQVKKNGINIQKEEQYLSKSQPKEISSRKQKQEEIIDKFKSRKTATTYQPDQASATSRSRKTVDEIIRKYDEKKKQKQPI